MNLKETNQHLEDSLEPSEISLGVIGLARNCSKTFQKSLDRIRLAASPYTVSWWVIVESDSQDRTGDILEELSRTTPNIYVSRMGDLESQIPDRISRIRTCREEARRIAVSLASVDVAIVADFDGPMLGLSEGAISTSLDKFSLAEGGSVVTANSTGRYFDIFALRAKGWVEDDYRETQRKLTDGGANYFSAMFESRVRPQCKISRGSKPLQVTSAFGGLALYPFSELSHASYFGVNDFECEHVTLNRKLVERGNKVWIDPELRVIANFRHVWASSRFFRPVWFFLRIIPPAAASAIQKLLFRD